MNITRVGTQPSAKGPAEWFTGTVRIDPLFQPHAPARAVGASVTFEPGARTAGHTHPLGQTLLITGGCGWVQREGGAVEEVHPGDVVWFSPGERHWHGATATTAMTHKPPKKGKLIKDKRCWIAEDGRTWCPDMPGDHDPHWDIQSPMGKPGQVWETPCCKCHTKKDEKTGNIYMRCFPRIRIE